MLWLILTEYFIKTLNMSNTKQKFLVDVFPSGDMEADETSQEGNDLVAGEFGKVDKLV